MSLEILKISRDQPEAPVLAYAAGFIARGDVVGIPTDTLYGLAADPFNLAAVEKIFRIKGRAETKALPILVNSQDQVRILARAMPESFSRLAKAFWPGALTLIVDAADRLPLKVTGNTGRIALRWPKCRAACELIGRAGSPLTGTSANLSGFPPCSSAGQVAKQLGHLLSLLLDGGETGAALPSTIVDVQGDQWRMVREGSIAEADILRVLAE